MKTFFSDASMIAWRNTRKIIRVPDMLVFITLQPIMFIVLFSYVFGGAVGGGADAAGYREFLIAGLFAQTLAFSAIVTGSGVAEDRKKGIMDRFRTLPMSSGAVLAGRTLSDVISNLIVLFVMSVTALLVGWRIHTSWWEALVGFGVMLLFSYALSWILAYVGLLVPSAEVVNNAAFVILFPMTFIANTFVPLSSLPGPLQVVAAYNPVSAVTQAARNFFGNSQPDGFETVQAWPLDHPALYTVLWSVVILAVFVPLASRTFSRAASR